MKTFLTITVIIIAHSAFAQWTTSGANIYNSNTGNVGIGTSLPIELLSVKRASDGNVASFSGVSSGLVVQANSSSFDIVGYSPSVGYKPLFLRSGPDGLFINTNGSIAIGSTNPRSKLDLNGNGNDILNYTNKIVDANYSDMISIRSATKASVLNLVSSRTDAGLLGGLLFTTTNGWLDSHANIAGIVGGQIDTGPVAAGYLSFWTKDQSGSIPRENMRITHQGNVGIGTSAPDAKLAVKGQIHAQEVKVDLNGAVAPDYVFASNYQLPTLDYIKTYIDQNKHLPEVPSAKEMEANGVKLGEMNMLLLKKIEELTLYQIEANRQIELLQEKIEKINTKN